MIGRSPKLQCAVRPIGPVDRLRRLEQIHERCCGALGRTGCKAPARRWQGPSSHPSSLRPHRHRSVLAVGGPIRRSRAMLRTNSRGLPDQTRILGLRLICSPQCQLSGTNILLGSPRILADFNRSKSTNIIADGGPASVHLEPDSRAYNRSPPFYDIPLRRPLIAELTLAYLLPIGKSGRGRRRDRSGFSSVAIGLSTGNARSRSDS